MVIKCVQVIYSEAVSFQTYNNNTIIIIRPECVKKDSFLVNVLNLPESVGSGPYSQLTK
jgi:hypothetical protein